MSTAAVMLVKDEADIIEPVLRHLRTQVDFVLVSDNGSTDGTKGILRDLVFELDAIREPWLDVLDDEEPGYWQSKKTTQLAMWALERGFSWVVPCDADEVWYAPDGRPITAFLDGVSPDVQAVKASLYNHIPTALDPPCATCGGNGWIAEPGPEPDLPNQVGCQDCGATGLEPNPLKRIGWRKREHGALPKVACRLRPDLVIDAGNHSASTSGTALTVPGLVVRHFSWRTREQYLRKIRNGEAAYAATSLPPTTGEHWRMWASHEDATVMEHFDTWFYSRDPHADASLIYDPAPVST